MEILHNFDLFVNKAQSLMSDWTKWSWESLLYFIQSMGLQIFFRDKLKLNGKEITNLTPPAEKLKSCGIAYILQDNSVFPDMTVEENLLMGGYTKRQY